MKIVFSWASVSVKAFKTQLNRELETHFSRLELESWAQERNGGEVQNQRKVLITHTLNQIHAFESSIGEVNYNTEWNGIYGPKTETNERHSALKFASHWAIRRITCFDDWLQIIIDSREINWLHNKRLNCILIVLLIPLKSSYEWIELKPNSNQRSVSYRSVIRYLPKVAFIGWLRAVQIDRLLAAQTADAFNTFHTIIIATHNNTETELN